MAITSAASSTWQIRNELSDRVRVYHPGLSASPGLRRHCGSLLHRTHWLLSHRINAISSTVVIRFNPSQKNKLTLLLERCFVEPFADSSLEQVLSEESVITDIVRSSSFRQSLKNGLIFGSVLFLDSLVVLPPFSLGLAAALLSLPLLREFSEQIKSRLTGEVDSPHILPSASVELALNFTLIGSGLARESLVDGFLSNSTSALQSISENTDGRSSEFYVFLDRLKTAVFLRCESVDPDSSFLCSLGNIAVGQHYSVKQKEHVYLPSRLLQGELVITNSMVDGSSLPFRIVAGDFLPFGAFVLSGEGRCEVVESFSQIDLFQIDDTRLQEMKLSGLQQRLSYLYSVLVPPAQLGLGLWSLFTGFTERAIGLLAFNPIEDSERSKVSSDETALLDMALNGVHIADASVLSTLTNIKHIAISINALHYLGSFSYEQQPTHTDDHPSLDLIQILWAICEYLCVDPSSVFWGILEDVPSIGLMLHSLHVNVGESGQPAYSISLDGHKYISIRFTQADDLIKVQFSDQSGSLGDINISWSPDEAYVTTILQLNQLGVDVSIVGSLSGRFSEFKDRKAKVLALQHQFGSIAYLGDVIDDIPAMAAADIAIGYSEDNQGFISKTVCDVLLAGDFLWLPRLMQLSRNYVQAHRFNTSLIVGSSLILTVASIAATLTPLQSIILFNAAPIIAELNTLAALNSSSSRI
jgi:hypothetical protein